MSLDPTRTLRELAELRELTGDAHGAQRVAFTPAWAKARAWLATLLAQVPQLETHRDAAGNLWSTLPGAVESALLIGGHIDSVPNGGWLDGCLNTLAGVAILRRLVAQYDGRPPVTVRLVDWADEEGARFGKSLFGSSACCGSLNLDEVRGLRDRDGVLLADALPEHGLDLERVKDSHGELAHAAAYLELHIEQGPVLLDLGLPLGAVLGTFGVERHRITFRGQAAHAGSTPMARRHDAFLAAARLAPEIYAIAARHGGVCTIGSCVTLPGIPTSVVAECQLALDQRHLKAATLAQMLDEARQASAAFARAGEVTMAWEPLLRLEPVHFDPNLIALCDAAIGEVAGRTHRLPSGPLHDASEVSKAGIPTAMMFVQSLHGISHNNLEDTRAEDLNLAIIAFDRLVEKAVLWLAGCEKIASSSGCSLAKER